MLMSSPAVVCWRHIIVLGVAPSKLQATLPSTLPSHCARPLYQATLPFHSAKPHSCAAATPDAGPL